MSSACGPQTGLNAAFERRTTVITQRKAAKTAMLTTPVNIATLLRCPILPLSALRDLRGSISSSSSSVSLRVPPCPSVSSVVVLVSLPLRRRGGGRQRDARGDGLEWEARGIMSCTSEPTHGDGGNANRPLPRSRHDPRRWAAAAGGA